MQRKLDKQTKLISETEKEYLQQSNSLMKTEEKRREAETMLQIHQSLPGFSPACLHFTQLRQVWLQKN